MIRNDRQYRQAQREADEARARLEEYRRILLDQGCPEEQTQMALAGMDETQAQLDGAIEWYERATSGQFPVVWEFTDVGYMLVAMRIAKGWTQRRLAEELGVSESNVARDEQRVYAGTSLERAQRVLDALDERAFIGSPLFGHDRPSFAGMHSQPRVTVSPDSLLYSDPHGQSWAGMPTESALASAAGGPADTGSRRRIGEYAGAGLQGQAG